MYTCIEGLADISGDETGHDAAHYLARCTRFLWLWYKPQHSTPLCLATLVIFMVGYCRNDHDQKIQTAKVDPTAYFQAGGKINYTFNALECHVLPWTVVLLARTLMAWRHGLEHSAIILSGFRRIHIKPGNRVAPTPSLRIKLVPRTKKVALMAPPPQQTHRYHTPGIDHRSVQRCLQRQNAPVASGRRNLTIDW